MFFSGFEFFLIRFLSQIVVSNDEFATEKPSLAHTLHQTVRDLCMYNQGRKVRVERWMRRFNIYSAKK